MLTKNFGRYAPEICSRHATYIRPRFVRRLPHTSPVWVACSGSHDDLTQYFLQFFKKNPELVTLRLDLDYGSIGFIRELTSLIVDSKIKQLYFGNTPLDLDAYNTLDLLLDNNYYLQLKVPEAKHEDEELNDIYTQLVQRAAKNGYERFKEEQLTQQTINYYRTHAMTKAQSHGFPKSI